MKLTNANAICNSATLLKSGAGLRFTVQSGGISLPAFAIRHSSGVAAYINRCAHMELELDWDLGHFFDRSGRYIMCASHGALYMAESGECIDGPCKGLSLESLEICEEEEIVYLTDSRYKISTLTHQEFR